MKVPGGDGRRYYTLAGNRQNNRRNSPRRKQTPPLTLRRNARRNRRLRLVLVKREIGTRRSTRVLPVRRNNSNSPPCVPGITTSTPAFHVLPVVCAAVWARRGKN